MTSAEPDASFSVVVRSSSWRAEAEAWIAARLDACGLRQTGPTEQRRIRPWSTQLVTPTVDGPAWFKANAPGLAHEPALHALLAAVAPDRVDAPLGVDTARGWMLTRDRGATLADHHDATLEEWCEIVREAADLQRRLLPHTAAVLATGLQDCSPATVLERFEILVDRYAALPPSHPSHLSAGERRAFEAVRPEVAEAATTLADSPLPVTLNHGDLHPGNVLLVDGGLRLFDFGDAQWASAPETLGAMWGWLVQRTLLPWETVFAAYAEGWSDLVTRAEFDVLVRAAMVTLSVNRSLTWWDSTASGTDEELREWGEAPLSQLRHLLRPWP